MSEPLPIPDALSEAQLAGEQRRQLEERRLPDHMHQQRRAMLIMSAITFALTWGGIYLSSINVLGIQISR